MITELGIDLTVAGVVVLFVAGLYVTAWFEDRRKRMSAHDHRAIVPGCYRCEMNADELGIREDTTDADYPAAH